MMTEQYKKWMERDWDDFRIWLARKVMHLGDRIEVTKDVNGEVYVKFRVTL